MTGKQQAVLWSGILLIILRMTTTGQWTLIWNTITVKQSAPTTNPSSSTTSPNSGGAISA